MENNIHVLAKTMCNCGVKEGKLCGNYCRDCRYIEMDNDAWNDNTRRCSYKGEWVRPSSPACSRFEP